MSLTELFHLLIMPSIAASVDHKMEARERMSSRRTGEPLRDANAQLEHS